MFRHFRGHRHEHRHARHGWHGWHGRHGLFVRRAGRGRPFGQGDLRFVALKLIAEKPRHGYEIIKEIEEAFGGTYSPSPGVVYPTLTHLEDIGHASVTPGEGTKKLYTITPDGLAFLENNKAAAEAVFERMSEARRRFSGGPPPEILRAAGNLYTALQVKLEAGPLSPGQTAAIAEAIDAAAARVERC
jgi:DNA-binding PadR family transcriptional regulator